MSATKEDVAKSIQGQNADQSNQISSARQNATGSGSTAERIPPKVELSNDMSLETIIKIFAAFRKNSLEPQERLRQEEIKEKFIEAINAYFANFIKKDSLAELMLKVILDKNIIHVDKMDLIKEALSCMPNSDDRAYLSAVFTPLSRQAIPDSYAIDDIFAKNAAEAQRQLLESPGVESITAAFHSFLTIKDILRDVLSIWATSTIRESTIVGKELYRIFDLLKDDVSMKPVLDNLTYYSVRQLLFLKRIVCNSNYNDVIKYQAVSLLYLDTSKDGTLSKDDLRIAEFFRSNINLETFKYSLTALYDRATTPIEPAPPCEIFRGRRRRKGSAGVQRNQNLLHSTESDKQSSQALVTEGKVLEPFTRPDELQAEEVPPTEEELAELRRERELLKQQQKEREEKERETKRMAVRDSTIKFIQLFDTMKKTELETAQLDIQRFIKCRVVNGVIIDDPLLENLNLTSVGDSDQAVFADDFIISLRSHDSDLAQGIALLSSLTGITSDEFQSKRDDELQELHKLLSHLSELQESAQNLIAKARGKQEERAQAIEEAKRKAAEELRLKQERDAREKADREECNRLITEITTLIKGAEKRNVAIRAEFTESEYREFINAIDSLYNLSEEADKIGVSIAHNYRQDISSLKENFLRSYGVFLKRNKDFDDMLAEKRQVLQDMKLVPSVTKLQLLRNDLRESSRKHSEESTDALTIFGSNNDELKKNIQLCESKLTKAKKRLENPGYSLESFISASRDKINALTPSITLRMADERKNVEDYYCYNSYFILPFFAIDRTTKLIHLADAIDDARGEYLYTQNSPDVLAIANPWWNIGGWFIKSEEMQKRIEDTKKSFQATQNLRRLQRLNQSLTWCTETLPADLAKNGSVPRAPEPNRGIKQLFLSFFEPHNDQNIITKKLTPKQHLLDIHAELRDVKTNVFSSGINRGSHLNACNYRPHVPACECQNQMIINNENANSKCDELDAKFVEYTYFFKDQVDPLATSRAASISDFLKKLPKFVGGINDSAQALTQSPSLADNLAAFFKKLTPTGNAESTRCTTEAVQSAEPLAGTEVRPSSLISVTA